MKPHNQRFIAKDNSGIKKCYSINFLSIHGNFGLVNSSLTDVVIKRKWKKGDLVRLVVFGQRTWQRRLTGINSKLNYNGVVATKKDKSPLASRLYGSLYLEARHYGYLRLAVLSRNII